MNVTLIYCKFNYFIVTSFDAKFAINLIFDISHYLHRFQVGLQTTLELETIGHAINTVYSAMWKHPGARLSYEMLQRSMKPRRSAKIFLIKRLQLPASDIFTQYFELVICSFVSSMLAISNDKSKNLYCEFGNVINFVQFVHLESILPYSALIFCKVL